MHSCTFSSRSSIPRKIPRSRVHNQTAVVPAFCSFQKAKCFPLLRVHSALQQEKLCARRISRFNLVVGSSGLEPPTSRLSGVCSNQLSYEPISSARGRRLFAASVTLLCHAKLSLRTVTRAFRSLISENFVRGLFADSIGWWR